MGNLKAEPKKTVVADRMDCDRLRNFHRHIWTQYLTLLREVQVLNRVVMKRNKRIKRLQERLKKVTE